MWNERKPLKPGTYLLHGASTTLGLVSGRRLCIVWNLVTLSRQNQHGRRGLRKAAAMSASVPIIALSALVALSLIARQRDYAMTSTSLLFLTGALAAWMLASYSIFG